MSERKTDKNIKRQTEKKVEAWGFPQIVVGIYVFAVLCILPLVYHNYYFDILETKYFFYCGCAIGLLSLFLGYWFFTVRGSEIKRRFQENKITDLLSVTDMAMVAFILISILSTVFSKYRYESFWGNEGRYTGLFLLLLYTGSYFVVTRYLIFKKWMLDAFLIAGSLMNLFGITDYFQMNLLGFKDKMSATQMNIFFSTIGNINTYTAMIALVMAVAAVLFAGEKNWRRMLSYYVALVISFFAIIMGNSDNAYLALAALLGLLPLYLFRNRMGVRRYLALTATFFSVSQVIDWINTKYVDIVVGIDSVFQIVVGFRYLFQTVIVMWILVAVLYFMDRKATPETEETKKNRMNILQIGWLILICIVVLGFIYILYDANATGNAEKYGKLSSYLILNDDWGTHRGFIWRIGIENYMQFPFLQKLFGYGPDTFGIITVLNNKAECVRRYGEIFDSAHNEYLQYFVTIGSLGLIAYLTLLGSACVRMFKRGWNNPYVIACAAAVICYGAQAFVNINLPIATPVMWVLMMVGLAECRIK